MGLGSSNSSGNLVILKLKTKDEDNKPCHPYFEVKRKKDGDYEKTDEKPISVGGELFKIDADSYTYEGEDIRTVKVFIRDNEVDEVYLLNLGYNMTTRGLINSLLSLENPEDIGISLYETESKQDKSKKYPAISLWDNTEEEDKRMVKWKYSIDELPEIEKITDKKGKVVSIDSEDQDEFLERKLMKHAKKLLGEQKKKSAPAEEESEEQEEPEEEPRAKVKKTRVKEEVEDDDDVPF